MPDIYTEFQPTLAPDIDRRIVGMRLSIFMRVYDENDKPGKEQFTGKIIAIKKGSDDKLRVKWDDGSPDLDEQLKKTRFNTKYLGGWSLQHELKYF